MQALAHHLRMSMRFHPRGRTDSTTDYLDLLQVKLRLADDSFQDAKLKADALFQTVL
jgi:hypothetical protein